MRARIVSFGTALFVLATSAVAQQFPSQARGLGAEVAYQGGQIGRVNLFNGGLTIPLAIGQRYSVGPALSYGVTLVYTSNGWDHELQTCTTASGTERYYLPDRRVLERVLKVPARLLLHSRWIVVVLNSVAAARWSQLWRALASWRWIPPPRPA